MTCVIIDYASGNLHSAEKSFQRMAAEAGGGPVIVTDDPDAVRRADRIVLPGVGAFADCRAGLLARAGLFEAIAERVIGAGAPFLGICVGMQLMASRGLEHGLDTPASAGSPAPSTASARPTLRSRSPHGVELPESRRAAPTPLPGSRTGTTPISSTPTT